MPHWDIFSTFLGGDDRMNGRGPPRSNWEDTHPDGMNSDIESMLHQMDQMMSHAFRDFDQMFQRLEPHGSLGSQHIRPFHPNRPQQSTKGLRHQFLRNVDDDPGDTGKSSLGKPSVTSDTMAGQENRGWEGVQATWRPLTSLFPETRRWPSDSFDSSNRTDDVSNGTPGVTPTDGADWSSQPVIHTTVFSSSSVRHSDGSVETKTYNRDASGHVRTSHSRQLPDQRTVTTYEERARDGTVSTRDEISSDDVREKSPEVNLFPSGWKSRTSPSMSDSPDLYPVSRLGDISASDGIDWMKSNATSTWNWAKSWFR